MMTVRKNMVVSFRYSMENNKGEVIENTTNGSPTCYLHGSSGIKPELQSQFEGLKVGGTRIIYLKKEDGLSNDDFTFNIIIDKLRPALEEEVMLGYPVLTDDLICDDNCVCYTSR